MLQIKKSKDNHIILTISDIEKGLVEIEILESSCVFRCKSIQQVEEFKENVMELKGENNICYYLERAATSIHVYDNHQVDIHIT